MNRSTAPDRRERQCCLLLPLLLLAAVAARAEPHACAGVELLVLGSGGPELDDGRASTGYAVLVDGRARVLVDAGPGTALAFDRAALDFADLEAIALTHLHVDHSADLPAFVKGGYFTDRTTPLPVLGPAGNDRMPATEAFVSGLFATDQGPWRYLGDHLPGGGARFTLDPRTVTPAGVPEEPVLTSNALILRAATVNHGPIPALAWRVEVNACTLAFSGDMNGGGGHLEVLARGAHLLVAHAAIPEGTGGTARQLHMPPSEIGRIAAQAEVHGLLLSHFMRRTLADLDGLQRAVADYYPGPLTLARDGLRVDLATASISPAYGSDRN